ncbi:MAG TPA: threonylcarbamoyl-AMP synthase [Firmicutes bacterium]|nr:threonylcarbamoyl-AMP synthase [Bacillota bacterium]
MSIPILTITSATAALRRGEVIAYPTETFYGLGAIVNDRHALERIVALKQRDEGKPVSVILGRAETVTSLATSLTPSVVRLISLAWPGPLTVVLQARDDVDEIITGGTGTVAVRVPSHAHARILADASGGAITATSANIQGEPPPSSLEEVCAQFPSGLAGIVGGESTPGGFATTLVRPVGRQLYILRSGVITESTLRSWWTGDVIPDTSASRA